MLYYFCELFNKMVKVDFGISKFAIVGMAGYIAPRHLDAIKNSECDLVAAHDVADSVGIMDRYFPHADFTTDADKFAGILKHGNIDYPTVCTPNYLHCRHSILGLRNGMNVICEKPLGLRSADLDAMASMERTSNRRIYPILQLRLHPEIQRLRQYVDSTPADFTHDVELTYITPRGKWYAASWKGDVAKSGGVVFNIGIHFLDILIWIFGDFLNAAVHHSAADSVSGVIELQKARVKFFLSVNPAHASLKSVDGKMTPCRCLTINGVGFNFTDGFTDLHTLSYRRILEGKGFSIEDARPSISAAEKICHTPLSKVLNDCHPLIK